MCVFQKGEHTRVVTNVYSRKNVRKTKKKGLRISKIRVQELFTRGKVLAPHTPATRDGSL